MRNGYSIDFLETENELRSYFIGLFVADGWLGKETGCFISLADKQLIDDIASKIQYTNTITHVTYDSKYGPQNMWRLNLTRMRPYFVNTGITHNKTGNEFLPEGVSNTFNHFVRGVSDGDGSFSFIVSKTGKRYLEWSLVSASETFLNELKDKMSSQGVKTALSRRGEVASGFFRLRAFGQEAIALGDWIYKDHTICLNRKNERYIEAKSYPKLMNSDWSPDEDELAIKGVCPAGRTYGALSGRRAILKNKGITLQPYQRT